MDQQVVAGIGNVYRAELLFRHRIDPYLPGRELSAAGLAGDVGGPGDADAGRGAGRPDRDGAHRATGRRKRGPLARDEAGYVYRRHGLPCRVCGTEIRTEVLVGRNLFWCPYCQPPGSTGHADWARTASAGRTPNAERSAGRNPECRAAQPVAARRRASASASAWISLGRSSRAG